MSISANKKGIVVAGLSGGSGKSVASVGLITALTKKSRREGGDEGGCVVPFKKGPDYIDAGWMQLAAKRRCYNLDPYFQDKEGLKSSFSKRFGGVKNALYAVVEGNRGLYDGVDADGGYSTAELAITLDLPILLVVNCSKVTRTVAAQVLGCQLFDRRVRIAGVILNNIATERQKRLITESVERYTSIPVVGVIPRLKTDIFPMRHLGVLPHQEYGNSEKALSYLTEIAEKNIDIEAVIRLMAEVEITEEKETVQAAPPQKSIKIGILQDAAFQFYYSENLEALEREGAELITLSAMSDAALPEDLDGLYIGGGFPETGAAELSANRSFRRSIKEMAEKGLPIYAECGGLIYLGEALELEGEEYPLVGFFPARFTMAKKPQAHGYSIFSCDSEKGFYPQGRQIKGHEFRYSIVSEWRGSEKDLAVKMVRGKGFWQGRDGLTRKNVFALYSHIHAGGVPDWAAIFIGRCRNWRRK